MTSGVRDPISDDERPYLRAFGAKLRSLRNGAGLTQGDLAVGSGFSMAHVQRLEYGTRRPRASTIRRLSEALALTSPTLPPHVLERPGPAPLRAAPFLTRELIETVGPALAPESDYRERIERRRDRAQRKLVRALEDVDRIRDIALDEALEMAKVMAEDIVAHMLGREAAAGQRRRQRDYERRWKPNAQEPGGSRWAP